MKFPVRDTNSHKGQNGKVLVIGGNDEFHGAPILTALGAEKSGADLIFLMLPEHHAFAAKMASENFIISPFQERNFAEADLNFALEKSHNADVVVIGNGLGKETETHQAIVSFLSQATIPVVIDADTLIPEILEIERKSEWIMTPHSGEFERVFHKEATSENIAAMAQKHHLTILKKGAVDIIASKSDDIVKNETGVPQMSVGGTGDALAGLVAGLWAQKLSAGEACETAAFLWGKCGEYLAETQYSFSAREILTIFPKIAKHYDAA